MRNVHRKAYQEFLRRLRRARKESGYTQTEVAKKLKRPQSYVSKAECGERRLDFVEVREFAALYGKEINYFE